LESGALDFLFEEEGVRGSPRDVIDKIIDLATTAEAATDIEEGGDRGKGSQS
jgi:hypothetical protein